MTFTYQVADLTTDLAKVRLRLGDTSEEGAEFADEEILLVVSESAHYLVAAANLALMLAFKYARLEEERTVTTGGVVWGDRAKKYRELATALLAEADRQGVAGVTTYAGPAWGGRRQSTKDAELDDADLVPPYFTRKTHEVVSGDPGVTTWRVPGLP
jgi:hypothetical protein